MNPTKDMYRIYVVEFLKWVKLLKNCNPLDYYLNLVWTNDGKYESECRKSTYFSLNETWIELLTSPVLIEWQWHQIEFVSKISLAVTNWWIISRRLLISPARTINK